jgi:hypothetical protein
MTPHCLEFRLELVVDFVERNREIVPAKEP